MDRVLEIARERSLMRYIVASNLFKPSLWFRLPIRHAVPYVEALCRITPSSSDVLRTLLVGILKRSIYYS
jgi:hypothetical protein